jgi:hypothetical protein
MPAIDAKDLVETACVGVAELLSEGACGVVFIITEGGESWRVTVERDEKGEA